MITSTPLQSLVALFRHFPPLTRITVYGRVCLVCGYQETPDECHPHLVLTPLDPENSTPICGMFSICPDTVYDFAQHELN
jgi:hypothetical protein